MRRVIASLMLLLAATVATAQVPFPQTLPANTVYGRLGIGPGPGQAIPFSVLAANPSLLNSILNNLSAASSTIYATSAGVVCDNATDNTAAFAALSTLIGSGAKRVVFPAGRCLTTAWSLSGKTNIVVEGAAGQDISELSFGTYIVCTRSDSSICFNWADGRGIHVRDITFAYNSSTYSGTLMSQAQASSTWTANSMTNVQFKQTAGTSHSAAAMLYVRNVVQWAGVAVKFEHAQAGLVGGFTGESILNTTNLSCFGCTFIGLDAQAILNPGEQWTFVGTWFFPRLDGTPIGIVSTGTAVIRELNLVGVYMTDATLTGNWITAANGIIGFNWNGGVCGNDANHGNCITGTISASRVAGVRFANLFSGITFGVGSTSLVLENNELSTVGTPYVNVLNCDSTCFFAGNLGTGVNKIAIAANKALTINNTLTFQGTDATTFSFPGASDTVVVLGASQALTNKTYNGLTVTSSTGTVTVPNATTFTTPTVSGTPAISVPAPLSGPTAAGAVTWAGLSTDGILFGSSATAVANNRCTMDSNSTIACTSATSTAPLQSILNSTADSGGPSYWVQKNRSGGNSNSGDVLGNYTWRGFANSAQQNSANIRGTQTAAASGSNIPSKLELQTSNTAGTLNQSLTLNEKAHLAVTASAAPTLTAGCNGAGSAVSGNPGASNVHGTATGQTAAATTCTLTFANSGFTTNPPDCVVTGLTAPLTGAITVSTTTLVINFASVANFKFTWHCFGL